MHILVRQLNNVEIKGRSRRVDIVSWFFNTWAVILKTFFAAVPLHRAGDTAVYPNILPGDVTGIDRKQEERLNPILTLAYCPGSFLRAFQTFHLLDLRDLLTTAPHLLKLGSLESV
jgi:hypothetical protein